MRSLWICSRNSVFEKTSLQVELEEKVNEIEILMSNLISQEVADSKVLEEKRRDNVNLRIVT